MVDTVVFDIGKVLIGWSPEAVYDRLIGAERRRALFAAVDLFAMNEQVDLGVDLRDAVTALAAEHANWASEIMIWHDHWAEMASPALDDSVTLLRRLRAAGVPVFALSNFGRSTFALAEQMYPFLTEFDQRFISGHLGVTKPNPAIYEIVERETGVPPERLFFTDDRPENVAAAEARGWTGHVFTGADGLATRLAELGLG